LGSAATIADSPLEEKCIDWKILEHFQDFFAYVAQGKTEIYNEFSLQHELGCYLRFVMVNVAKI
jgi:hypothetical protein